MIERTTILVLRFWVGLTWLRAGWNKLSKEGGWTDGLLSSIERSTPTHFYEPFIANVVVPNPGLFVFLITWGEFLVGFSLVLGVASRVGALVAMFMSLNYMLLQDKFFPGYDGTLFVAQFVLFLAASGRVLGADRYFSKRWPNRLIW